MSRRKNHVEETPVESNPTGENGEMATVAEASATARKKKTAKSGGFRCMVSQGENEEWVTVAQTKTSGQMKKWYAMSYTLIHKTYSLVRFERYYDVDEEMKPIYRQ